MVACWNAFKTLLVSLWCKNKSLISLIQFCLWYLLPLCQEIFTSNRLTSVANYIPDVTGQEGKQVYGENWKLDETPFPAHHGLLNFSGVYKSKGVAMGSLLNANTVRAIFPASTSLETFPLMTEKVGLLDVNVINSLQSGMCGEKDVKIWPLIYSVAPRVTVD